MVMLTVYCTLLCICASAYRFMCCFVSPYSYFPHVLSLHIMYIQLQTLECINFIIYCNIVHYSYLFLFSVLHILFVHLQTLKYINCIINRNIVPYSYFPHVLSLHILYIQLQTVKHIIYLFISVHLIQERATARRMQNMSSSIYITQCGTISLQFSH